MRPAAPIVDQLAAAAWDALRLEDGVATNYGARHLIGPYRPAGRHLQNYFIARLIFGSMRRCGHLTSPAAAFWIADRPDELICVRCMASARHRSGMAGSTCDICAAASGDLHPGVTRLGPVVLAADLCRRCMPVDQDTENTT